MYEDLETNKEIGRARSAPSDGSYRIALVHGKQYGVAADAEGYYALSETMDVRDRDEYAEEVRDLLLTPIRKNVAIRLNNIFFDTGKYDLRAESYAELKQTCRVLEEETLI